MRRSSHRPAGHPWHPILFGTARIHRAWVSLDRVRRKAIEQMRRRAWPPTEEAMAAALAEDPLRPPPQAAWLHPTLGRMRKRCSVATGPGRLS